MLTPIIYRSIRRASLLKLLLILLPMLLLLLCCQSKLMYFPRSYDAVHLAQWPTQNDGKVLDYRSSEGNQKAFLLKPAANQPAQRLWLVCGGNGSLATDWTTWLRQHGPQQDAYLLIEYPGYGASEGDPSPKKIRENISLALPLAARELHWDETAMLQRTRFFGHSLGCAAALLGAKQFGLHRGVLLSPFTSTMDMSKQLTGLPLGFLVIDRYNNQKILSAISSHQDCKIAIFHGQVDPVIPARMASTLQQLCPERISLTIVPDGGHNDLSKIDALGIAEAMREIR